MKAKYAILVTIPENNFAEIHWYHSKKCANEYNKLLTNCYHKIIKVSEISFCLPDCKIEEDGIISTYTDKTAILMHRLFM